MSGRIDFGPDRPRLQNVTVHVWIEDTTYADVPAVRMAEHRIPDVSYDGAPEGIRFSLEWDDSATRTPANSYSLAAFIDVDQDGRPGRGDYICHHAVPVPQPGTVARVPVQRIG